MGSRLYQVARNVEVLSMYKELLRKMAEEKPSYHDEEKPVVSFSFER